MFISTPILVSLLTFNLSHLALASPAPLAPRIAQITGDSTKAWEAACRRSGGAQKCREISVQAFPTLLFAAAPCAQQDAADNLIDFAKKLNSNGTADMVRLAQIFVQQPRNTVCGALSVLAHSFYFFATHTDSDEMLVLRPQNDKLSVPYCQQAPRNPELQGPYQCQFAGTNTQKFVGGAKLGEPGTIPFGLSSPVSPPGSCAAHPSGPIPDGVQLSSITQEPFASGRKSGSTTAKEEDGEGDDEDGDDEGGDDEDGDDKGGDNKADDKKHLAAFPELERFVGF